MGESFDWLIDWLIDFRWLFTYKEDEWAFSEGTLKNSVKTWGRCDRPAPWRCRVYWTASTTGSLAKWKALGSRRACSIWGSGSRNAVFTGNASHRQWKMRLLCRINVVFFSGYFCSRIISRDTVWDRLIFKKVQEQMGGNIRFMIVGSAPLAPKVTIFFSKFFSNLME